MDLSQAKDQEYFCDGMSEEILDALAKVEGLRVVARTSSFSFKGKSADVSEVGKKLNVENVLEGSVRREGNRVRITTQLINARNGSQLWSETYERELQGVFALQDEITRAVVDALKLKLAISLQFVRNETPKRMIFICKVSISRTKAAKRICGRGSLSFSARLRKIRNYPAPGPGSQKFGFTWRTCT